MSGKQSEKLRKPLNSWNYLLFYCTICKTVLGRGGQILSSHFEFFIMSSSLFFISPSSLLQIEHNISKWRLVFFSYLMFKGFFKFVVAVITWHIFGGCHMIILKDKKNENVSIGSQLYCQKFCYFLCHYLRKASW